MLQTASVRGINGRGSQALLQQQQLLRKISRKAPWLSSLQLSLPPKGPSNRQRPLPARNYFRRRSPCFQHLTGVVLSCRLRKVQETRAFSAALHRRPLQERETMPRADLNVRQRAAWRVCGTSRSWSVPSSSTSCKPFSLSHGRRASGNTRNSTRLVTTRNSYLRQPKAVRRSCLALNSALIFTET